MNPKEHAKSAQRAGTSGSRPAALATGITMGTTMVAPAVLEVVSEIRTAMTAETADTATTLVNPKMLAMPLPVVSGQAGLRAGRSPGRACFAPGTGSKSSQSKPPTPRFRAPERRPDGGVEPELRPVKFSHKRPDPADRPAEDLEPAEPPDKPG